MIAEVGFFSLVFAFAASIYAAIISVYGARFAKSDALVRSGRNAAYLTGVLIAISTGLLWWGLVTQDYQIAYVWSVSSPSMPELFRLTALWGSQAGSLLFWSFLMSMFAVVSIAISWNRYRRMMPYAIAYMMVTVAFFTGLSIFFENPFERWWILQSTGDVVKSALVPAGAVAPALSNLQQSAQGLNPLLRHFGMAIHPPLLYLGFVGFVIPFAYAMAALASGDLSTDWIKATPALHAGRVAVP